MCNSHEWSQQYLRSCRNGSNIRRFGKKCWELLAQKFDGFKLCPTTPNNMSFYLKNHNHNQIRTASVVPRTRVTMDNVNTEAVMVWTIIDQYSCSR